MLGAESRIPRRTPSPMPWSRVIAESNRSPRRRTLQGGGAENSRIGQGRYGAQTSAWTQAPAGNGQVPGVSHGRVVDGLVLARPYSDYGLRNQRWGAGYGQGLLDDDGSPA
jgi:hypothetical protein